MGVKNETGTHARTSAKHKNTSNAKSQRAVWVETRCGVDSAHGDPRKAMEGALHGIHSGQIFTKICKQAKKEMMLNSW